ncbi:glycosyltransferase family 8 protein [Tropicimonas aquimaris]|uniref:Glycosyltransferase family 8 protein n=1 Tax=Tropicimonas aquimaris TaxID=914152 RepID=A0ABW3IRD5_9RHOB
MNLAFGCDDNYALPLGVTLHSLLRHLEPGPRYRAFVIDGGISETNRRRIARIVRSFPDLDVELIWLAPDMADIAGLYTAGHVTSATYFSLQIAELTETTANRVLFLDCDLLIRENILDLWQSEVTERSPLQAVRDFQIPTVASTAGIVSHKRLGLDHTSRYLNAGVLLIDVPAWIAANVTERVLRYLTDYHDALVFRDQEGLNAVLAGMWGELEPRWNVQSAIYDPMLCQGALTEFGDDGIARLQWEGAIYHFTGAQKPWHAACTHPLKPLWLQHLAATSWNDPVSDGSRSVKPNAPLQAHKTKTGTARVTVRYKPAPNDPSSKELVLNLCDAGLADVALWQVFEGDTPAPVGSDTGALRVTWNAYPTSPWLNLVDALADWNPDALSDVLILLPEGTMPEPEVVRNIVGTLNNGVGVVAFRNDADFVDIRTSVLSTTDALSHLSEAPLLPLERSLIGVRAECLQALLGPTSDARPLARHGTRWAAETLILDLALSTGIAELRGGTATDGFDTDTLDDRIGEVGALGLRTEALARLLAQPSLSSELQKRALERLIELNRQRSECVISFVPSLAPSPEDLRKEHANILLRYLPDPCRFILVGDAPWIPVSYAGRVATPLVEQNGQNAGFPRDEIHALQALNDQIDRGATHIAFTRSAFWWRDSYGALFEELDKTGEVLFRDPRIVIYRLRPHAGRKLP